MNDTVIAIRTADGSWFPVLDRHSGGRKRVILTTARAGQERVNIDMYEGPRDDLPSAEYIGSLVIEGIDPAEAGEVEIEFVAGVDGNNNLKAQATNRASGDSQSLSVSLLDRDGLPEEPMREPMEDMPDFSMEDDASAPGDGPAEQAEPSADDEGVVSFDEDLPDAPEPGEDISFDEDLPELESDEAGDFSFDDELPELETAGDTADDLSETSASPDFEEDAYDLSSQLEEPPIFDMPDAEEDLDQDPDREQPGGESSAADEPERFEDDLGALPDDFPEEEPQAPSMAGEPEGFIAQTDEGGAEQFAGEMEGERAGAAFVDPATSASAAAQPQRRRPSPVFYVVYMVLALAILAGVVYLIFSAFQTEPIPPLESVHHSVATLAFAGARLSVWRWRR